MTTDCQNRGARVGYDAWIAVLMFASLYAPQSQYYGRGHWLACALFAVWLSMVFVRRELSWTLRRFQGRFLLLPLFFLITVFTYEFRGGDDTRKQFINGTIDSAIAFTVAAYYAQCGTTTHRHIRRWVVILLGLAVLPSLPSLYANPGIARPLATGDETYTAYFGYNPEIMKDGVGSYALYTASGIAFISWTGLLSGARHWSKLLMCLSLAALAAAVALSTFTMAAALMFVGVCVGVGASPFLARSRHRWLMLCASVGILLLLPIAIHVLDEESEAFRFVHDKTIRLIEDGSSRGIVDGDSTGRSERFLGTCETFLQNPLLGCGFDEQAGYVGGHSSLVDHWAVFGLLGYWPWFLLQAYCTYVAAARWRADRRDSAALGSAVSWGLYWIGAACNPVAFSILPAMFVFTDCYVLPPRKNGVALPCVASQHRRGLSGRPAVLMND